VSQYNSVLEWIRSAAIPLATVEPRQGYRDLEPLRSIIARARIVSLGEATHGTREFFKLKHRMLEFCVAELGFSMFILEASFPESPRPGLATKGAYAIAAAAAPASSGARRSIWPGSRTPPLTMILSTGTKRAAHFWPSTRLEVSATIPWLSRT